ncbi:MAG: NADPH:quinone reductase [Nitrospirae bacterium]|nr:NADPH:quinone reductase [Nitrospirota bacterium]
MKAIRVAVLGDPEVMRMEEIPDPVPGAFQVVVKVQAAGVNPVDTYIRSGQYALKPGLPYTPGMDASGVIESVGDKVTGVSVGERVYVAGSVSGTYAEKTLCNESQVHKLPSRISFTQGAGVGVPYSTAYYALFYRARALAGETVLVHGASGGVGLAAVQLSRNAGMTVIGTSSTEQGQRLAAEQGAHYVVDHKAPDHMDKIRSITGGRGVDVILEMLANVNLGKDLGALAFNGRVVVIGSRGTVEIDPRVAMGFNAAILGMSVLNAGEHELFSIHAALAAGLENGTLRPVIGREFPLSDAARAHHEIMETNANGKIVLIV